MEPSNYLKAARAPAVRLDGNIRFLVPELVSSGRPEFNTSLLVSTSRQPGYFSPIACVDGCEPLILRTRGNNIITQLLIVVIVRDDCGTLLPRSAA